MEIEGTHLRLLRGLDLWTGTSQMGHSLLVSRYRTMHTLQTVRIHRLYDKNRREERKDSQEWRHSTSVEAFTR